jgi:hypothetical protein
VLKGFHGQRLSALFEAYPDARIVYLHRDPVQVTASRIQLALVLHEGLTGKADDGQQVRAHLAASRAAFHNLLDDPVLDDPRIFHLRYRDFVSDRLGTIRAFYEFADQDWTAASESAMTRYMDTNRGDRYGKFEYSTDIIGEDIEKLHAEFAPYRDRFGVEIESGG